MAAKPTKWADRINRAVAESKVGYYFRLDGCGHPRQRVGSRFLVELRAGLTTGAAMLYIIAVNASILSDSGGTCECTDDTDPTCLEDPDYNACVSDLRRQLVIATAAISCIGSFLMGLLANLPIGMAPGLGLNAYFAYSLVGFRGTGQISYRDALGAVFLEGWIFMALALLGVRQWLARALPKSLVLSIGVGIGLFIAFIGMKDTGLSVVGADSTNLLGLGGCPAEYLDPEIPKACMSHVLQLPTMWLGIFIGGVLTVMMMMWRVRGAIILGVLLVSIISWPRQSNVTYFPYTDEGNSNFDYFKKVVTITDIPLIGGVLNHNYQNGSTWYALISFLYVDLLDTTGTLYAMSKFAGLMDPITGDFEGSTMGYMTDGFCVAMGSLMGMSPVTAYVESATGISDGGRTGITAMTTGFAFFIAVFFSPIFSSLPPFATGSALVIVGSLMARNATEINWNYLGDAVPAFVTLITIPLTFNIAYGIIAGLILYMLINGLNALVMKLSKGKWKPENFEAKEKWTKPPGGLVAPWMRRVMAGDKKFWRDPEMERQMNERTYAAQTAAKRNSSDEMELSTTKVAEPVALPEPVKARPLYERQDTDASMKGADVQAQTHPVSV